MAEKKRRAKIQTFHGFIIDALTGAKVRPATATEAAAFRRAKKNHGGIIVLDGRAVRLGGVAAAKKSATKKRKVKSKAKSR